MEGTIPCREARDRLHRRALSQASTASSTIHSPKTTKSASTSSSHPRTNTSLDTSHIHRHHRSHCDRESAGLGQPPRLSRESSSELKRVMTPVSSLLQERLQQERRAECERLASKPGADLTSSISDTRDGDTPNSSGRRYKSVVERRPESSHDDNSSQASMGAKQMEKTVSTLHKQNFDLKLELFHRREKQSALETRVEELEAERRELTDIQENLLGELIKRDKAIEEAVNMIVKLEARLDELVAEKEMVRQIEDDDSYRHSWSSVTDSLRTETPRPSEYSVLLSREPKTLERMPSFLSDRSVHTQHLRSVVLQNRTSLRHTRKVSEVSTSSAEVSEVNRVASPSLSMLSESSFVSIYGSKQGQAGAGLPLLGDVLGMDGTFGERSSTPTNNTRMNSLSVQKTSAPSQIPNMAPRAASRLGGQGLPANNVLRRELVIRETEKPGETADSVGGPSRSSVSGRRKSVTTPISQFVGSPSRVRTKRERSQTLQRVMTNYPIHKELGHSHALPPTPDTVSSSVLRKHKDLSSSQDSLLRSDDTRVSGFLATALPHGTEYLRSLGNQQGHPSINMQKTSSLTAPRNYSELSSPGFIKVNQDALLSDLSHLARSAASNAPTGRHHSDSFVSDSDSDGGADARSDAGSCDYWMRESYKPDKKNTRSNADTERGRSPSPDLFSFPVDAEGWQPDAMFGALKGGGFLGSPVPALKRDPFDELAPPFQSPKPDPLEPTAHGPQPPSRRSSLNAQAAGHFLLSSLTGKTGRGSSREGSVLRLDAKGRRNSVDGSGVTASATNQMDAAPIPKRSQYPPISGLQSRTRGLGFNSLFRRSGSESYGAPSSATDSAPVSPGPQRGPPMPPAHLRHLRRPSGRNSVPPPTTAPWVTRPIRATDDDFASATPPPIMRDRPLPLQTDPGSSGVAASGPSLATEGIMCPGTPVAESTPPVAPQNGGGVRKWLGLGRKAGPGTRAG